MEVGRAGSGGGQVRVLTLQGPAGQLRVPPALPSPSRPSAARRELGPGQDETRAIARLQSQSPRADRKLQGATWGWGLAHPTLVPRARGGRHSGLLPEHLQVRRNLGKGTPSIPGAASLVCTCPFWDLFSFVAKRCSLISCFMLLQPLSSKQRLPDNKTS